MARIHDIPEGHKWCSRCKRARENSAFSPNRSTKGGLQGWCTECRNEYRKQPHILASNRAAVKAWRKRYPEKYNEAQKKWRAENPDKHAAYQKAYRERQKAKRLAEQASREPAVKLSKADRERRNAFRKILNQIKGGQE